MSSFDGIVPLEDHRKLRCTICKQRFAGCLCGSLRRIEPALPTILLQHSKERFSQSNTGNLVWRVLEGTRVLHFGGRDEAFEPERLLQGGIDPILLYPLAGAATISATDGVARDGRTPVLLVLDATWAQARRMFRRIPGIRGLRVRRLPPEALARWKLRLPAEPGLLGTAEAVAMAYESLGLVKESEVLWDALDLVAAGVLRIRGRRWTLLSGRTT